MQTSVPCARAAARVAKVPAAVPILTALLALALAFAYHVPDHDGFDDAYITYVYARNVARGLGFVFYAGSPPVLGTTTPLYTLLLAGLAKAGLAIPQASMVVGALSAGGCAALLVALGKRAGFAAAGILAAVVAFAGPNWWRAVEGMETPLYALIILGAIWASASGRHRASYLLAVLATMMRIDGIAVLAAVGIVTWYDRRLRVRDAWPAVALLAVWLFWLTYAFGNPIPTSGAAKRLEEFISGKFSIPLPLLVAATWGAIRTRRERVTRLLVSWLALYVLGFALLGLPNFSWYYAPAALVMGLLTCMGAEDLLRRLQVRFAWRPGVSGAQLGVLAAAYLAFSLVRVPLSRSEGDAARVNQEAGRWLASHTGPHDTVVAYETGFLAWESDRPVIDSLGLTEPAADAHLIRGDLAWALARRPTWVFMERPDWDFPITQQFDRSPMFAAYRPVVEWSKTPNDRYVLYRRLS